MSSKFTSQPNRPLLTIPQGFSLKMEPQTGRTLEPLQEQGISQVIFLNGVEYGNGAAVKMRWKVSYKVGGEPNFEQGEIQALGVA